MGNHTAGTIVSDLFMTETFCKDLIQDELGTQSRKIAEARLHYPQELPH